MWQFICPKCKGEVKKNSHECPHCGERFPLAIRVPPSFLKDPKKLEAYVHKHVFPRVSEFERNYLTKYFTILFQDGFESGNFSAWTSITGTPTVVTSPVHHGTYAMKRDAGETEYATKNLGASYNNVWIRLYWQTTGIPTINYYANTMIGATAITLRYNTMTGAGTREWELLIDGGYAGTWVNEVTIDTWHCIEVEFDNVDDVHRLYVDGVQRIAYTVATASTVSVVNVGHTAGNWGFNVFIDCVVVADAYIGPEEEAAGQPYVSRVQAVAGMNSWTRQAKAFSERMPIPILRRF